MQKILVSPFQPLTENRPSTIKLVFIEPAGRSGSLTIRISIFYDEHKLISWPSDALDACKTINVKCHTIN